MSHAYKIITKPDEATGELGWSFEDLPFMDDVSMANEGYLLAHDLCDHQNGLSAIGGIGEELQAMGAIWHRGKDSGIRRQQYNSSESMIASDVGQMWRDYTLGEEWGTYPEATEEHDEDESFNLIIDEARENVTNELELDEIQSPRFAEYERGVINFLRTGYDKAVKRYNTDRFMHSEGLHNLIFWNIAEALDPIVKHVEFEGQEAQLTVDWETGEVEAHEITYNYCEKCEDHEVEEAYFNYDHNMCSDCAVEEIEETLIIV